MSHIPNSAMPHAQADAEREESEGRLEQMVEMARQNPKTAVAAGAALAAGVVAVAATAIRSRGRRRRGP